MCESPTFYDFLEKCSENNITEESFRTVSYCRLLFKLWEDKKVVTV